MDTKEEILDLKEEVRNFFREGGLLAQRFDNYEHRKSQEDMALAILDSLENKKHLFVEAPTGVGKSFAYLVPAILYAKKHNRKALISTHTINLQEQLILKDIPFLQEIMPVEFKASLMKGKSNYICPKRLRRAGESANILFENEEEIFLERLNIWARETRDGTKSDIRFPILENVWSDVCAERGVCSTKTCGVKDTECFFQKAKMQLEDSDVIILNHHLFFTLFDGLKNEDTEGYLYKNDFLIFDEAHTIESIAADHLYPRISREMLRYNLFKLYNEKKRKGFLLSFPSLHIFPMIQNLLELNHIFFSGLKEKLFSMNGWRLERLAERVYEPHIVKNILEEGFTQLIDALRKLRPMCQNEWLENELNEYILRFSQFRYLISDFLEMKKNAERPNEFVYWVEVSSQKPEANISLCSSPIDLSDFFRENIFRENHTSILTSATLTVDNRFLYFKRRLGGETAGEMKLPSQFDFDKQVKIYVSRSIPPPTSEHYQDILEDQLEHYIKLTDGKALVLFTNSFLMRKTAEGIRNRFSDEMIDVLVQGEGMSRNHLLNEFKSNINSVLFGLDSFWLGVDVPGESLSNLVITKLPFMVPDHPMIKARMEYIESKGGNSFMEYSLPEAILKFRQGIGRLIRSKRDTGIIVLLDSRIVSKFYGKYFLNSIDKCEIIYTDQ